MVKYLSKHAVDVMHGIILFTVTGEVEYMTTRAKLMLGFNKNDPVQGKKLELYDVIAVMKDGRRYTGNIIPFNLVTNFTKVSQEFMIGIKSLHTSPRWIQFTAFVSEQENYNKSRRYLVILSEVNEKSVSVSSFESPLEQWANSMDLVDDVMYLLDEDQRLVRANRAFYNMLNTNPQVAVGRDIGEVIHPYSDGKMCRICQAHEERRDAIITMYSLDSDNPTDHPVEVRVKNIKNNDGIISGCLVIIHDLSQTWKTKERIDIGSTVFENTFEGLMIVDNAKNIISVNQSASDIIGYTIDELSGKNLDVIKCENTDSILSENILNEIHEKKYWRGEVIIYDKRGNKNRLLMNIRNVSDSTGVLASFVLLFIDICNPESSDTYARRYQQFLERRIEEELNKRKEQEQILIHQSRSAALGEMMGMIAHQWKQPLTTLSLIIQDLVEAHEYGELSSEYVTKSTGSAMGQITYMSDTIDEFRDFFKPDREKRLFRVGSVVSHAVDLIFASMNVLNIQVKVDVLQDSEIMGYPNELSQVILNLLSNARDALKKNKTSERWIGITAGECVQEYICIVIEDNGGGIPINIANQIFEPYFTTKENMKGTGIGLYMSKMIVEKHMNGKIELEHVDGGVKFIVKIKK